MEEKTEGVRRLTLVDNPHEGPRAIEFRVMAQRHIQEACEDEQRAYVRDILRGCRVYGITRYVVRSSGMSLLLGEEPDLARLARWVQFVREVQAEKEWV